MQFCLKLHIKDCSQYSILTVHVYLLDLFIRLVSSIDHYRVDLLAMQSLYGPGVNIQKTVNTLQGKHVKIIDKVLRICCECFDIILGRFIVFCNLIGLKDLDI